MLHLSNTLHMAYLFIYFGCCHGTLVKIYRRRKAVLKLGLNNVMRSGCHSLSGQLPASDRKVSKSDCLTFMLNYRFPLSTIFFWKSFSALIILTIYFYCKTLYYCIWLQAEDEEWVCLGFTLSCLTILQRQNPDRNQMNVPLWIDVKEIW